MVYFPLLLLLVGLADRFRLDPSDRALQTFSFTILPLKSFSERSVVSSSAASAAWTS